MSVPTRTSRVRSRRRLLTRTNLHVESSSGRLSPSSTQDLPTGPDVVELVTGIAETIANRLVAQISSSFESLRLEVSSLATCDPEAAYGKEHSVHCGSLNARDVRRMAGKIPDGPAVVSSQVDPGSPGPNQVGSSPTTNQNLRSRECVAKDAPSSDCSYYRASCISHCVCSACQQDGHPDLRRRLPKLEILLSPEIRKSMAKYLYDPPAI
ncbi:hypothetical protein M514_12052 [Trichuris suis]|uniref:Uncharacterized protein n=1 Tax=Trichuris suis TaxID=68888 RepID=A0A085LQ18_9BILA|nr:hypothetical protein M513_12052 [Trichuris suis]KFD61342.1 hypothetical protein M514_12052 [Trichuris suis]